MGLPTFDIIDDPWLDALGVDGSIEHLSLRRLLKNSHRIARLSEPSPLTEVALLRFLIALVSDGLRERLSAEEEWRLFFDECQDGLPNDAIDAILASMVGRSDVLDLEHDMFFDGPAIRRVRGWDAATARQTISRFLPELPTGTNVAHFAHVSDENSALCIGCLLKSRAVDSAFARGGLGPSLSRNLLATISGTEPRYVIPVGDSLLKTFLLNVMTGDPSRPSWVSIHSPTRGEPGPIARMTWRPRLILPVHSSETDLRCACCARTNRPRFTQAIMVDTYNQSGAPFGTKDDVERWKAMRGDPHLLPFEKNAISLGDRVEEWPLRAITRLLTGEGWPLFDNLPRRASTIRGPVMITVTSSSGNQAKIDDAPHANARIPLELLARSPQDLVKIAAALRVIFDKSRRERLRKSIPHDVPWLLSKISVAENPSETISAWLEDARTPIQIDEEMESLLRESAKPLLQRLLRLSPRELAALRPIGLGGSPDVAMRQAAFEAIWHRGGLPSSSRRHALREALAAVAPIYALYSESHRSSKTPRTFESLLRRVLSSERATGADQVSALLPKIIVASAVARDDLLRRLVGAIVNSHAGQRGQRVFFDFTDLLIAIARWNDPINPTPARWRRILPREDIAS